MKYYILSCIILFGLIGSTVSFAGESVSAYYYLHKADSISSLLLADPQFISIRSDSVDTLGRSKYWNYHYQELIIYITEDSIACDTFSGHLTGSAEISIQRCINSDSAMYLAEINGGKQFRNSYSDYHIECNLGHDSALPWEEWDITYKSKNMPNKKIIFVINARTGEIFHKYTTDIKCNNYPNRAALMQNYPNPFNSFTTIEYSISKSTFVNLTVYDIKSRPIAVLTDSYHAPGIYKIKWHFNNLSSGTYFYRLKTNDYQSIKKFQLIK